MQQRFLLQILLLAQHVLGTIMPIIRRSSGAQEYYTVVAACGIWCCGFSSCWSGVEMRVMCLVCSILQTGRITLSSTPDQLLEKNHSTKYHTQQPLYNTLELLMMGIVMPETC